MTKNPNPESERPIRNGPRPLMLHLWMAASCIVGSSTASRHWSSVWPHLKQMMPAGMGTLLDQFGADLDEVLGQSEAGDAFADAVEARGRQQLSEFLDGIAAYRRHPFCRPATKADIVWELEGGRLFDYGVGSAEAGETDDNHENVGEGRPLIIVPSLINGSCVLDLLPGRSFVGALCAAGFRPFLLDWGQPSGDALDFDLGDVISFRLEPAFDAARDAADVDRLPVVGYCMGGNLALALAARRQRELTGLALLATPWDFHAARIEQARAAASVMSVLMPAVQATRAVPIDLLQSFFAANDPLLALRKFSAFGRLDMESDTARHFVALEDWLNDGVPLPHKIARECFADWYGENLPARGEWRVGGQLVRPDEIDLPAHVIIPNRDRIVPPPSAERLARALPNAERRIAPAGHIGMVTGRGARRHVYTPMIDWLSRLPA